jgi:D-glycero-D-manno-heptose 1,7-bisphosphate phosphatase
MHGGRAEAFFLDRDGVIIEDAHYLADADQVRLLPGAAAAIAQLNRAGVAVVVVTNQSGVARGLFPESRIAEVHQRLDELLAREGARIDRYYHCPHHPTEGVGAYRRDCDCRKPRPGMLLRAAAELGLDLSASWMVGDKLSDAQAAHAAGCRTVLVRTGKGTHAEQELTDATVAVVDDLAAAVELFFRHQEGLTRRAS